MATESTSSESTHGLDYTIWKAMASSNNCAEFLCVMMSLPYMFGFQVDRWINVIDCMIRKKDDIDHIHMCRLLVLMSADQNTSLKFFAGKNE